MKTCYLCEEEMPTSLRKDARYCSPYCRDLVYRIVRGKLSHSKAKKRLNKHRIKLLEVD